MLAIKLSKFLQLGKYGRHLIIKMRFKVHKKNFGGYYENEKHLNSFEYIVKFINTADNFAFENGNLVISDECIITGISKLVFKSDGKAEVVLRSELTNFEDQVIYISEDGSFDESISDLIDYSHCKSRGV